MTKARDLANLISTGNPLADGAIAASEVSGLHAVATSGAYSDVTGTPSLAAVATSGAVADVTGAAPLAGPTFTGDVTLPDKIVHTGDTNTAIRFPADDTVAFETGGSERFRFASAGQLGIAGANYGTSGQVLQSGGASGAASWADAGGGAYEVISDAAYSSGSSSVTFSVSPDYNYQIEVTGLEVTAGGSEVQLQASHDSFSSKKVWEWWVLRNDKFGATAAHTYNESSYVYARISYGNIAGDTTDSAAMMLINFQQKTGKYPIHMSETHEPDNSSHYPQFIRSVGRVRSTDTINQIRLLPNSGDLKASRIRLLRRA
tara:strand:+ start:50 stop:1000 length:951 start_codon:yes stop_codon:yes gene_type:complete